MASSSDVRRVDQELVREEAPKIAGLIVGDGHEVMLPNGAPVGVFDIDTEAVVPGSHPGPLVLLVLGDMHATPSVAAGVVALLL